MAQPQQEAKQETEAGQQVVLDSFREHMARNFGARCTLVSVASVLCYYGAVVPAPQLAVAIGKITGFTEGYGPPNRAYLPLGKRPLLDRAIEQVAREHGIEAQASTRLLITFRQIARALDAGRPVVLNMVRAPGGTWSHSVVAYGYRQSPRREVLILDPNDLHDYWFPYRLGLYYPVTATFVGRGQI